MAAGVFAYGIGDLQEAGVIPGWGQPAYSLAGAIPPSSWYGALLGGVFNFTPEPTWAQVIGWVGYAAVVTFFFLRQIFTRTAPAAAAHGGHRALSTSPSPTAASHVRPDPFPQHVHHRSPSMKRTLSVGLVGAGLIALTLTGCVPNNAGGTAVSVAIADDACDVSTDTTESGAVTFELNNTGTDVNEFEILAEDKLRIVGEKENVTPGQTVSYVAQLEPGTYYTACKFQLIGSPIGLAEFTVTGDATAVDADAAELNDAAVTNYIAYIRSQVGELIPAVSRPHHGVRRRRRRDRSRTVRPDPRLLRAHRADRRGVRRPRPQDRLPRGRRRRRGPGLDRLPPHREGPLAAGAGRASTPTAPAPSSTGHRRRRPSGRLSPPGSSRTPSSCTTS